jgi:uncharacterized circularly permuted ATP-grasp superfamily protein
VKKNGGKMKQTNTDNVSIFDDYQVPKSFFDEAFDDQGQVKSGYNSLFQLFSRLGSDAFSRLNEEARRSFFNQGITFAVYNEPTNPTEKIFPFDLVPRIIDTQEWDYLEKGVLQRATAINEFLWDIYHDKKILLDKVVPADLIMTSQNYLKAMIGVNPPGKVYNHISGTDLIRHIDGKYYVLEDNLRCPSGVSYVLNNRIAMKRLLTSAFSDFRLASIVDYSEHLLSMLQSVKPSSTDVPRCVVLTPGVYNSAYFEHAFLAQTMGEALVEGRDLFVDNGFVYMKTIHGPQRVDVIYRRVDDEFIDPLEFREDSMLGVPGLMSVYRKGNVTIVNAPGNGVADDKAVYAYVPDIIKYYLNEEPILNNVQTYHCARPDDYKYVMEHVHELVVKPVDESGGYGITIGHTLTKDQIKEVQDRIKANPRKYIAQPVMSLSVLATYIEEESRIEPRHIDLRTFTLLGKNKSYVLKGGLTRVALRRGNLIVNSSQGGGSKDTWVMEDV